MNKATARGRSYRGLPLDARRRERREAFLEAGVGLFGTQGYQATSVKAVCLAAKLTERYFYESFENREAFFAEVYEMLTARLRAHIVGVVSAQPDPGSVARQGLTAFFLALQEDPRLARILLLEVTHVGGDFDKVWRKGLRDFGAMLAAAFAAFFPGADPAAYDLELLVAGLIGSSLNIAITWYFEGFQKPLKTVVDHAYLPFVALQAHLARG